MKIKSAIDTDSYNAAMKVSDKAFAAVNLKPRRFNGAWNYAIG